MKELKEFLQSRITLEGHGKENTLKNVYETFEKEFLCPYEVKRNRGVLNTLTVWLMGLPSCLNIPYKHANITPLMYALGYEVKHLDDASISRLYFRQMAIILFESYYENKQILA